MSRILKVQELVNVIKEYEYEVPDDISNEEFIKELEKTEGEIYKIDDYLNVNFIDSEYLYETELHCSGSETLIIKDNKVIGTIV
jgi:signal peptidase I